MLYPEMGGYFISIKERKKYFPLMVFLSFFGAFIAYKNISMFTSIGDLQSMLVEGDDISGLRAETGDGGIGGIFKMFAAAPLCVFLLTSGLYFFTEYDLGTKITLKRTMVLSVVATLVKVFIYFDRLSLLAIIIVLTYHFFYNKKFNVLLKIVAIFFLVLVAAFVTLLRMTDANLGQFLGLYFN